MMWVTRTQEGAQIKPGDDHRLRQAIWNGNQAASVRGMGVKSIVCTVNAKHEGVSALPILLRVNLIWELVYYSCAEHNHLAARAEEVESN